MGSDNNSFAVLGGSTRWRYRRSAALMCAINVTVVGFVFYALFLVPSHAPSARNIAMMELLASPPGKVATLPVRYTQEELERVLISHEARRAVEPWALMKRLKEMGFGLTDAAVKVSDAAWSDGEQKGADELAQPPGDAPGAIRIVQDEDSDEPVSGGDALTRREEGANSKLDGGKLRLEGPEIEDGIIPGRPVPAECNAEPHTDYDGAAVRWGLTNAEESAADCCQACLDQARSAKHGDLKCNIWVYCPAEEGCFSPDMYEHRQFECWLKQSEAPRVNFKGRYAPDYRLAHPKCPQVVGWASGVVA